MKKTLAVLLVVITTGTFAQTAPDRWLTYYEKSGFKKTPRYNETMEYCRRLQKASPWIKVTSFGKSPEGRDLPLVIVSTDKAFTPAAAAKTGKAIILIQNGIHAGEIDGKDACLMLMRDMVIKKTKAELLDHLILLIIPIYNVDGHERFGPYNRINQNGPEEMGWRVTSQNLNLNRDYMKADAPETQAWLKMFNEWLPDFFIDDHVTDGADYQYVVTFGMENGENVASPVQSWINNSFLPTISRLRTNDNVPVGPLIFLKDDLDPLKGLQASAGTAPPRFSTTYTTLQNRPGMLVEMHMLKDYQTRVEGISQFLEATLRRINQSAQQLRQAVRQADQDMIRGEYKSYAIEYAPDTTASGTIPYYGIKQSNSQSDLSGGIRRIYQGQPFQATIPVFERTEPVKVVNVPYAYLIPPQWKEVIERLKLHGLKLDRLESPTALSVSRYKFSNAHWNSTPFEGRIQVQCKVETSTATDTFPRGTIVVRTGQRAGKVAIHALEPEAPDAFVQWGFFNAIFEQKEYAEDYVMESYARDMLKSHSEIGTEYQEKVQSDSTFARSPNARLNFFYQRSPYWDKNVNLYPVARLMSPTSLTTTQMR